MTILLGYRRKSMVRHQADLISPERQMRSCELWLEMQDGKYTIEWYEDIEGHRSGRYEKGRPGWQALMAQLERPDVVGVIADSFDRMYRNVHQFLNFLNRLEQLNKKLITVKEGLDTSSGLGRAIVTILMVIYQLESDQTSDRMAANVRYKREVLGRHWGPTPFGCDRDGNGQLVPTAKGYWLNAHTGEVRPEKESPGSGWEYRRYYDGLKAIYQVYAGGKYGYVDVAGMVNEAGWRYCANVTGSSPRKFTHDDIRRLVSFWQLYQGQLPLGNITNTRNAPVLDGGHDPILPIELCAEVGRTKMRRAGKTGDSSQSKPQRIYLLSNILFCAVCGKALKGQFHRGKRTYRHYGGKRGCPERWVLADEIEAEVLEALAAISDAEILGNLKVMADELTQAEFAKDESIRVILDDLEAQKKRLTRLEDLYLDEAIDKPRYLARKVEVDQAIATLEDRLFTVTQVVNLGQIIDRMTTVLAELASETPETQKTLVNIIFQRLEVGGGHIIHFTPHPWAKPFF